MLRVVAAWYFPACYAPAWVPVAWLQLAVHHSLSLYLHVAFPDASEKGLAPALHLEVPCYAIE